MFFQLVLQTRQDAGKYTGGGAGAAATASQWGNQWGNQAQAGAGGQQAAANQGAWNQQAQWNNQAWSNYQQQWKGNARDSFKFSCQLLTVNCLNRDFLL